MRSDRSEMLARYDFEIDRFQTDAFDALDDGNNTIVAAPTGSGKTVVAEYGLDMAVRDGKRAFYTAPIKALSNQKYRDLVEFYGEDNVGLLTGDNAINGDAPVVVMTTEVLRNMIYGGRDLSDLAVVVVDEVHFLQDAYRGPVWEEVIIHLPAHVQMVCLSATVSNTDELAEWIETVRGPTTAIVEHKRPVELENMYLVDDKTNRLLRLYSTIVDGRPNQQALQLDASATRYQRGNHRRDKGAKNKGKKQLGTPTRADTVRRLNQEGLLPAIFFIFSRNQCTESAQYALNAGLNFTNEEERDQIRAIAERRLEGLTDDDLKVLGYDAFIEQLLAGVAAHHAGMVPPFKEVVEQCFIAGLIKVVFATETLAVGVNMPARSVVIDKLTKFTGEHHENLSPAQYSQLTGRAGRRGLDDKGSAVVLWSPFVRFDQAAELAMSRSFHLRSAFRPTYNMAANLVRTYDQQRARQLLSLSFAQFQADRDVVKIERRLQRQRSRLVDLLAEAKSPFGDITDYRRMIESGASMQGVFDRGPIETALIQLNPGTLIYANKGKYKGPVAVVATSHRKGGLKVTAITASANIMNLVAEDFDATPIPVGDIVLPGSYSPNQRSYREEVGKRIKSANLKPGKSGRKNKGGDPSPGTGMHPVEADPDLRHRLRTLDTADKVRAEVAQMQKRVDARNATLTREFDSVLAVVAERGYVDLDNWELTEAGEMLARTFHESDLLICEAIRSGLLDDLDAASLAGMVSTFVYEHRSSDDPPAPWFPNGEVRDRFDMIARMARQLVRLEERHDLSTTREPEPTFFAIAYAWIAGEGFAEVVADDDLTGGDFVRNIKQLIDLLGQIAVISPNTKTQRAARQAAEAAFRGVVADSSNVTPVDE